jgi:WD40 repeat protein
MLVLSAALALVSLPHQRPTAPMPRPVRGWAVRHTFIHKAPVTAVATTADGYLTGDREGRLALWDVRTGRLRETLLSGSDGGTVPVTAVRSTPDGKRLTVVVNGFLAQLERRGKELAVHGPARDWSVFGLGHDGRGFTTAEVQPFFGNSGTLCAIEQHYQEGGYYTGLAYRLQHPRAVRLAVSGPYFVASVDAGHTVRGWKLNTRQEAHLVDRAVWAVDLEGFTPGALALAPDGTLIAVAGTLGTVAVLNTRRGETVATLTGHTGAVRAVAFTPDSGLIATGGEDGTVCLWNPWTGEQESALKGHTGPVNAVWFASDEVLMSASADKTARVWTYRP